MIKYSRILVRQCALLLVFCCFSLTANATLHFKNGIEGDHFVYYPDVKAQSILVIAHGMYKKTENPNAVAKRFIGRWLSYAEQYGLLVIAPVFDDQKFGAIKQGYGGYRNLFGRYQDADVFVNSLIDLYSKDTASKSRQFYLYGHSAGGQFANRYVVTHPNRIIKVVISAAGRYSFPTKSINWPYGAGDLTKAVEWHSPKRINKVNVSKKLLKYAQAVSKVTVVIGSKDISPQPKRPGHVGKNRIDFANSWVKAMNLNASQYGVKDQINIQVIPNISHDSKRLTPYCAEALFQ